MSHMDTPCQYENVHEGHNRREADEAGDLPASVSCVLLGLALTTLYAVPWFWRQPSACGGNEWS